MDQKGYVSVDQLRGSMSLEATGDASALVRSNYIRLLESYASIRR